MILTFLLFFTTSIIHASDNILISATLLSPDNQPIVGAIIYTPKNGVTSDKNGYFNLQASPGETVTIKHISYTTKKITSNEIDSIINLEYQAVRGSEINILGGKIIKENLEKR